MPLVLFLLSLCCLTCSTEIRVSKDNGDDSKCLNHQDIPCESLEFISSRLEGNCSGLTILIDDPQLPVSGVVSFENCTSLKICGKEDACMKLLCSNNEGFKFRNVTNLVLLNMEVTSCGHEIGHIDFNSKAAMHIHQCSNVTLANIAFYNSSFTALVISDTVANVTIRSCSFCCNNPPNTTSNATIFPSGIHIQLSTVHFNTKYFITECRFQNNFQQKFLKIDPHPSISPTFSFEYGYGLGGGMGILFMNDSQNITVLIRRCVFTNNTAYSGAGLYLHFQENAMGNTLAIADSVFSGHNGVDGGGLVIGMSKVSSNRGNYVSVNGSEFKNNTARYGAGTLIIALHGNEVKSGNMKFITFHNCTWEHNFGPYSPAVDMKAFREDQFNSGYLPTPEFTDCTFRFNIVYPRHYSDEFIFSGVFVMSSFTAFFGGRISFHGNKQTALKMTSGRVYLQEGTEVIFSSNEGNEGGAIAMYGFSTLVGNKNSRLLFDNNSAESVGGGIYYSAIEQREFIEGRSCFLQYADSDVNLTARNYTLLFTRNSATYGGSSIYATSFYSCFFACHRDSKSYNLTQFQECVGTFKFQDYSDNITALRTDGLKYQYNNTGPVPVIPGQLVVSSTLSIRTFLIGPGFSMKAKSMRLSSPQT